MSYFLGVEVKQTEEGIYMLQKKYAEEILSRFRMKDCKPISTPIEAGMKLKADSDREPVNPTLFKSLVGSLRYLTFTRPDIMFVVSLISRYMEHPKQDHFSAAKRILRYIKGTISHGLFYTHSQDSRLIGYADSDYSGDVDDIHSRSSVYMSSDLFMRGKVHRDSLQFDPEIEKTAKKNRKQAKQRKQEESSGSKPHKELVMATNN
ncbi:uncharacterized mitochondrial protein AtMg00810-like [Gastrolobium bilobum]|uniref:uncharacterized mitochondrial protein AtMg00810-like n=1 Tax=Gastrolobium bilobum TaxID=150636 RepID=UPI002AAF2D6E|nr:uncharacterized mitochondrial protein AtMg00810-like [Gastrolobium bilobum]